MNYFSFHIGDYATDARYLSLMEDLAYRRLLDLYYQSETPIPLVDAARAIGMREHADDVEGVLRRFFVRTDAGWTQSRCDKEIAGYRAMGEGGRRGAAKRWGKGGDSPPIQTPMLTSNHEPVTNNQEEQETAPAVLPALSLRAKKPATPPPDFDGQNSEVLNGRHVVALSATWDLPEEWGVDAEALGWRRSEVLIEAEKFRQYWAAGKGSGTRRAVKGWRQSWSNWLGKAAERKQR